MILRVIFTVLLFVCLAFSQSSTKKIERLELLELRDITHQIELLKAQMVFTERRIKDLEADAQGKLKSLYDKYKISPTEVLNLDTGEIKERGPDEK